MTSQTIKPSYGSPTWGLGGTFAWGVLIFVVASIAQTVALIAYGNHYIEGFSIKDIDSLNNNGSALYWASFAELVAIFVILVGIKLKKQANVREYLALYSAPMSQALVWLAIAMGVIASIDL